jgi:phage-related minor tail protein
MTDIHSKKSVGYSGGVNPIAAGIAGIVVGGAAVAAAIVMSDKKNRKKMKVMLSDTKDRVNTYFDANSKKIGKAVHDTKKKIAEKITES